MLSQLPEDDEMRTYSGGAIKEYLENYEAELMRLQVLDTGSRADGRRCDGEIDYSRMRRIASHPRYWTVYPGYRPGAFYCHSRHRLRCSAS